MNKSTFLNYSAIFGFLILFTSTSFADVSSCASNFTHCAYSIDQTSTTNPHLGNYVKFTIQHYGNNGFKVSELICAAYGSSLALMPEDINQLNLIGDNSITMQVCSDASCRLSYTLPIDRFNVENINQASPATFGFSIKSSHFKPIVCSNPQIFLK